MLFEGLGGRLAVGLWALAPSTEVRILAPQFAFPCKKGCPKFVPKKNTITKKIIRFRYRVTSIFRTAFLRMVRPSFSPFRHSPSIAILIRVHASWATESIEHEYFLFGLNSWSGNRAELFLKSRFSKILLPYNFSNGNR